jgi:hypothetical protein
MLVADQLVGVAAVPLNVTVLLPWVVPKFVPAIVTAVPTGPLVGETLVTLGAKGARYTTSAEYGLINDAVLYAWTTMKYCWPGVRLGNGQLVTFPTSIVVV